MPADAPTVLLSYLVMLLYIAVALGRFPRRGGWRDVLVHSRRALPTGWLAALRARCKGHAVWLVLPMPTCPAVKWMHPPPPCRAALGLGGVLIVAAAVVGSLGLCSWAGMRATLIIMEVIPFLTLAGGCATGRG